jgi:AcrR family transcriptional regulator
MTDSDVARTLRPGPGVAGDLPGSPAGTATGSPPPERSVRHRRRGRALEAAVFASVVELLRAEGYRGLTMEGVASAAGTGKAALYRRWRDKGELVIDALDALLTSSDDLPDRGSLRADLVFLLHAKAETLNSPVGQALQSLLAEVERDRAFYRLINERVFAPRAEMFDVVMERARRRGEVAGDRLSPLVTEVGPALLIKHLLGGGPAVTQEFVEGIVDVVLLPAIRAAVGPAVGVAPGHVGTEAAPTG